MKAQARAEDQAQQAAAVHTLASLAELSFDELAALYGEGRVPGSIRALDGHPRGRMLAVRAVRGPASYALRQLASAQLFPWGGKSFRSKGEAYGAGVNRLRVLGRHALFPFRTSIAPSALDDRPCVVLDYGHADNPWLIRRIHDEIREVAPGLYLGPAMWKHRAGPTTLLWFALDWNDPAPALAFG